MITPRQCDPDCVCQTSSLPARPQGIRNSPDGLSVAVLYDSPEYGRRWVAFTCRDDGTIHQLNLLAPIDVRGWEEWSPPPMEMPPGTEVT